jgi:hypothetical protein
VPKQENSVVNRKRRGRFILAGAVMLGLWGASLVSLIEERAAFNIVAAAVATLTFVPLGLIALRGGISGSEANMQRASSALLASGLLLTLIVAGEILRRIVFTGV